LDPTELHQQIPVQIKPLSKGKYRVEYVAKQPGLHSVNVFFAGQPIPESPFGVKVAPSKLLLPESMKHKSAVDSFSVSLRL
jgi:filamin